jgi:XTP/dITP diphosphohydrolase
MKLNFVTSNTNKVREFKQILGDNFQVEQVHVPYHEMRNDSPEEIARLAAKQLAEKLQKPVVVEDSGLFITALKDFPGTCSAYIHKRIGLKGILKLMEGIEDRSAIYKSSVAYCEPGVRPTSFLGAENGKIAEEVKGDYGFGHDPIFVPKDSEITYGEMENAEEVKKFRRRAVEQLRRYLINKGNKK